MANQTVSKEEETPIPIFHRWTIDHLTWLFGDHFDGTPGIRTIFMVKNMKKIYLYLYPMGSRSISNIETKFFFEIRVYNISVYHKIFKVWIEDIETSDYKMESNSFTSGCSLSFISPKFPEKVSYTICFQGILYNNPGPEISESELDSLLANVSPTLTQFPLKPPSTFTIYNWELKTPIFQLVEGNMQSEHTFALHKTTKFKMQFKSNYYKKNCFLIELTECLTDKLRVWFNFSFNDKLNDMGGTVKVFTKNKPIKLNLNAFLTTKLIQFVELKPEVICQIRMIEIEDEDISYEKDYTYKSIYKQLKPSFFGNNQTNVDLENTKTQTNINCEANFQTNLVKSDCKDNVIKDEFEETVNEFVKIDETQLKENIKIDTEFSPTGNNKKTGVAELEFLNQIILGFLQNSETKSELINSIFIHMSEYLQFTNSPFKVTTDFILRDVVFPAISTAVSGKFQIGESTFSGETMTKLSQFIEESLEIFQKMIDKWIEDNLETNFDATESDEPKVMEKTSNEGQFVEDKTDTILNGFLETKESQCEFKNLIFKEITKQRSSLDSSAHITTKYILNNVILTSDSTFTAGNINLNSSSVSEKTLEKLKQFIDDSLKDIQEQLNKVAKIEEYLKEAQEKLNGINRIEEFLKQKETDIRYVVASENVAIEKGAIKVTVKIEDNKANGKFDMNLTIPIAHNETISQPMITIENESENLRVAVINPKPFRKCLLSSGSSMSNDYLNLRMYAYLFTFCDLSRIKKTMNQEELKSLEGQVEEIQQKYSRTAKKSNANNDVTFLSSLLLRQIKAIHQCADGKIDKLLSIEHLKLENREENEE